MYLIILIFSALALFLSAAAWKTSDHGHKYPKLLCIILAVCMALSGLGMAFLPDPYPGDPTQTVTAFFAAVADQRQAEAARMMTDGEVLNSRNLSDDGQLALYAITESLHAVPIGKPAVTAFSAVQQVQVEYVSLPSLLKELDGTATPLLKSMMLTREKDELFTDDGSDYLPALKEEVYDACFLPLTDKAAEHTVTKVVEVQLHWTPFGWKIIPTDGLLLALTGDLHTADEVSYTAMDSALEEAKQDFFSKLPRLHKIYTLDENITMGPAPDPNGFHATTDPNEVLAVIEEAAALLDGQTLSWSPDIKLLPDSEILYYYDTTILVIVWQELRDKCVVTFTEVKVAHPTQMFRAHCQDRYLRYYESVLLESPTAMAKRTNSVVAVTGDFYRRREIGTVVYQGRIYRNDPVTLDTCLFDADGNMHLIKARSLNHQQLAQYVEDNDIRFSASFGPMLIKDGKLIHNDWYSVGEILDRYDRCAIGQLDRLHYLILNANFTNKHKVAPVLSQAGKYLYEKGCVQAYTLDGGQTGSLVFNGKLINQVNYGGERTSSDTLCFVSGIPESDR